MRISNALAVLLAACGDGGSDRAALASGETDQHAQADDRRIPCARGGGVLKRVCTVDRERRAAGLVLTVRRPDGGFRRLLVTGDGRGVVAADGAEPARVAIVDAGTIAVALGDDRYLLPATVGGTAR
jgi:hypothetical protein